MNVVYLDIDGVLVRPRVDDMTMVQWGTGSDMSYGLSFNLCQNLDRLCADHNAGIVIHSLWRFIHSLEWLRFFLEHHKVRAPVLRVADLSKSARAEAIHSDLKNFAPKKHVVLDDEAGAFSLYDRANMNCVFVDPKLGFNHEARQRADEALS